jgi:hypothetical protein
MWSERLIHHVAEHATTDHDGRTHNMAQAGIDKYRPYTRPFGLPYIPSRPRPEVFHSPGKPAAVFDEVPSTWPLRQVIAEKWNPCVCGVFTGNKWPEIGSDVLVVRRRRHRATHVPLGQICI